MFIGAILVVGPGPLEKDGRQHSFELVTESSETLAGCPIAYLDILGQSMLDRTVRQLLHAGVEAITTVVDDGLSPAVKMPISPGREVRLLSQPHSLWATAECALREYVEQGAKAVLLMRLGAYTEFDLADLVRSHEQKNQSVTRLADDIGSLDVWLIRTCPLGKAAITGVEALTQSSGSRDASYVLQGYVNRLQNAHDLRRLVVDVFLSRCDIRPSGREIKPGVWFDDGVQVHRGARIVAPAYVGRGSKIRAGAVITRFSNLERGCEVGCGTVIEDASVLANTYLGKCLDVSHAVIDGNRFLDLRRKTAVEIDDARLFGRTVPSEHSGPSAWSATNPGFAERLLAIAWSRIARKNGKITLRKPWLAKSDAR